MQILEKCTPRTERKAYDEAFNLLNDAEQEI